MNHNDAPAPESTEHAAREAFANGLLAFHFEESASARERRIARAMAAIDDEAVTRRLSIGSSARRALRVILSAAASVALFGLIGLYFFSSTQPQALALVQESVKAVESAKIRRFQVRATHRDSSETDAHATIDVGAERRFRFSLRTPDGRDVSGGRGYAGEWAVNPRGELELESPRAFWPRWMFLLDDSLTGSPDELLLGIERDYEPSLIASETIDGVPCRHVRAIRRGDPRGLQRESTPMPRGPEPSERMGDMAPPPGVEPELLPFLPPPPRGDQRMDGPRPPRIGVGPMPQRGRFVPPDFIPRGEARSRMPMVIDMWIDSNTKLARRIEVRWDPNIRASERTSGDRRLPPPPTVLEFQLINSPEIDESVFESPAQNP